MTSHVVRRLTVVPRRASVVAAMLVTLAVCLGVAGAAPLGQIVEFSAPGTDPAQIQAGSDGNLWFSDRNGAVGRITPDGAISRFTNGLNPGSAVRSIAMGADGNMWFSDPGTTRAIGTINPITQVINEFSAGLNAGSMPLGIAAGPDGNVWFTDNGTTKAIGVIDPTTHAITEFSSGLNPGAALQQGLVAGPDGNLWFTDSGTTPAIGMINPSTHAITEFSAGLNPASRPGASIVVGPDGNLWFMNGGTIPSIGMINPTTHAITEFSSGLSAGSALGRLAAGADGNIWFGNKGATPAIGKINPHDPRDHRVHARPQSGQPPGRDGNGLGRQRLVHRPGRDKGDRTNRCGCPGRLGHRSVGGRVGRSRVPQVCGGDVWSTWAGQQPSHNAFGFDGYQWLLDGSAIAGATGSSYTPTAADAGHLLSCRATVTYTLFPTTVSATSTAVAVKGAAEQLDDLAAAVEGVGPGKSLAAKVSAIQGYVAANDTVAACATLIAFTSEVTAQTGKKISTVLAAVTDRAGTGHPSRARLLTPTTATEHHRGRPDTGPPARTGTDLLQRSGPGVEPSKPWVARPGRF